MKKRKRLIKKSEKDVRLTWHLLWVGLGYWWETLDFGKGHLTRVKYYHLLICTVRTTQAYIDLNYEPGVQEPGKLPEFKANRSQRRMAERRAK